MTVKQMYDFFESIDCDFGDAPIIAMIDGKQVDIINLILQKDMDDDGFVAIKMTEMSD